MISIFKNISKSSSNIILFVKINIEKTKISNLKSYKVNNKLIFDYSVATQSSGIQVNIFLREAPGPLNSNYIGAFVFDFSQKMTFSKISINTKSKNILDFINFGFVRKDFIFNKYLSGSKPSQFKLQEKLSKYTNSLNDSIVMLKNLVSEPSNILYPESYANFISKNLGKKLPIKVLDKKKITKIGLNCLLAVNQGSQREPRVVIFEPKDHKVKEVDILFVGKGVCFDTGGISIKPSAGMEEMKWDMGGSAVVTAVMNLLSSLNYNFTYAGIIGLVENMPSGTAYKPGDIIKSYKGTNVEVLNTDAEGRLVLADIITYGSELYKPKVIIDFATLTGSILVALGQNYAGLFSNDDNLADQIYKSGLNVDEKVWRMPMDSDFDKMMSSQFVDLKNISSGRYAGATTAAQFIQRFVPAKTKWAHLDIAGTTWKNQGDIFNRPGATGFGLLLMADFVYNYFENIKDK
jgi:leucyl aminopeptidase|tara:strand:+ start:417 stop:1805 length:1389 start_codon:yes stop_codon:yes gene_type:complete